MLTIWPSMVWTSVAQPTEQKGQTLGVTLASLIRSSCACATTGARLTPDAISPPSAVARPPATESLRTSRREISMQTPWTDCLSVIHLPSVKCHRRTRRRSTRMRLFARVWLLIRGRAGGLGVVLLPRVPGSRHTRDRPRCRGHASRARAGADHRQRRRELQARGARPVPGRLARGPV